MTNFNQILDELTQKETAVMTAIADKETQIADIQKELPDLRTQLAGLQAIKEQTEALIASNASNTVTINHNITVDGGSSGGAINHNYAA